MIGLIPKLTARVRFPSPAPQRPGPARHTRPRWPDQPWPIGAGTGARPARCRALCVPSDCAVRRSCPPRRCCGVPKVVDVQVRYPQRANEDPHEDAGHVGADDQARAAAVRCGQLAGRCDRSADAASPPDRYRPSQACTLFRDSPYRTVTTRATSPSPYCRSTTQVTHATAVALGGLEVSEAGGSRPPAPASRSTQPRESACHTLPPFARMSTPDRCDRPWRDELAEHREKRTRAGRGFHAGRHLRGSFLEGLSRFGADHAGEVSAPLE
jgi:hypothetical protein